MRFMSTRHDDQSCDLSAAIQLGLAPDGGLYVPSILPKTAIDEFSLGDPYPLFAAQVLKPFFAEDKLACYLNEICLSALNFPIPTRALSQDTFLLELFHGPTCSFKDVGARFLAACLALMPSAKPITIMVATSGDTGSAVASAFAQQAQAQVIILYPQGQITRRQEQQITCWGERILPLAVRGSFDDCQRLVKAAFQSPWWQEHKRLSSANSINIGRLLPQMTYYAWSSLQFYAQHHQAPGYIVPTGNVGNVTAAYWAKAMGFPIREIVLATNANRVIPDYLKTGAFTPRPSISTLANAMDVGHPSNFERLIALFPDITAFKQHVHAISVSDVEIKTAIEHCYQQTGTILCPHTATAYYVRQQLSAEPWIIVATADPAKFEGVIKPILNQDPPLPPALAALLNRPCHSIPVEPELIAIQQSLSFFA